MVETRCNRCHRPLSNPISVGLGYGPKCAVEAGIIILKHRKKKAIENYHKLSEFQK